MAEGHGRENPTQWQEAVKQINEYAAAPGMAVGEHEAALYYHTVPGWELERMEEV